MCAARNLRALPTVRRHLASVDSTNTYAKTHAAQFDAGAVTVVTTDEQTAGRGRKVVVKPDEAAAGALKTVERTWHSAPTGRDVTATFAFLVPPAALPTAYQLSPLIALVTRRVLRAHGIDCLIKWPNDLLLGGRRKFAGILCELEAVSGGAHWAALGIGINVNSSAEDLGAVVGARPVWPLTTLRSETGREHDVAGLTDALVDAFADVRGCDREA